MTEPEPGARMDPGITVTETAARGSRLLSVALDCTLGSVQTGIAVANDILSPSSLREESSSFVILESSSPLMLMVANYLSICRSGWVGRGKFSLHVRRVADRQE